MERDQAIEIADIYRKTLRQMKKAGLKVEDMPVDVAQAALALHQHALAVEGMQRAERRAEKKGKQKS